MFVKLEEMSSVSAGRGLGFYEGLLNLVTLVTWSSVFRNLIISLNFKFCFNS